METIHGIENIKPRHQNGVAVLGFFDGLHLGHQALFKKAHEIASQSKVPVLAYTFDRHPLEIVNPPEAPLLLTTLDEKIKLADHLPIDIFLIGHFDKTLSQVDPSEFIEAIVAKKLKPKQLVVGFNYRYGKDHAGDVTSLEKDAAKFGLSVTVVNPVNVDGISVSSSQIRKLLIDGKIETANRFLGRPYSVEGNVVRGNGRGASLGVPTANLEISPRKLLSNSGIYAGVATVQGTRRASVISVGDQPMFQGDRVIVEVHLLDFKGDLYDRNLTVEFLFWHRNQEKFSSTEDLKEAMQNDIAWAKERLASDLKE